MIPNQEPGGFAQLCSAVGAPLQELSRHAADWPTRNKAQPHLIPLWIIRGSLLPQHAITGEGFGIRIVFLPGLFDEMEAMVLILPGKGRRESESAPPHLVEKSHGPFRLLTGPGNESVTCVFFAERAGRDS